MSTLLASLGRWSYRHPWRVLVAWILLLLIAGGLALFGKGTSNTFSIPGTESQAGLEQLERTFPQVSGTSAQIVIVAADGQRIADGGYRTPIGTAVDRLEGVEGVAAVTDPYSDAVTGTISDDGTAAILRLQFDGQSTSVSAESKDALTATADDLRAALPAGAVVSVGGDLFAQSVPGVTLTEAVGLLIALAVLIVTFRSFVVAGLPLVTAIIGVGLSMALIFVATNFATVSATTPLLALMLGLAVGIDYALFIIARHQDQVRDGVDPEESAARATGTAGSAVVFAGVTVLIALVGLSFANIPFLTTMGIAAAAAVAIAVLVAVTLTPAFLGFARGRVRGWRRRGSRRTAEPDAPAAAAAPRRGLAARWVAAITKRPVLTTVSVVVLLGALAVPAGSLALALPNAGQLPHSSAARQTYDLTAEHFGAGANGPLILTGTIVTSNDPLSLMKRIGDDIATLPGVERVALSTPNATADTGIVQVIPTTAPDDPATAALVREIRAQHDRILDEYGVDLEVTGFTAIGIDISDRLGAALVPFGIFVVGLSLILLMIVFRSLWVPIKAALGYLLSVAASFGVVAAVFEWGWFADALHVARVGPIISFMPIVLMGVLFGLAMDYEMFLVTRMREDFVHARARTGDGGNGAAVAAVRSGFSASARVVTAAAVIMFAVFAAFVPEGDASLKPIALGLAVGILIDAFLVRMTLVPAVMALLGRHAWWLPRWLDRLLPHFDVEGEAVERELALAEWPAPGARLAVAADGLVLDGDRGRVLGPIDLRVDPGEALVLTEDDPRIARAAGLVLAARIAPTGGLLRVAGHLLPGRAAWVRAHVGVALLADAARPRRGLDRALRGGTALVVVDGLDALRGDARADVVAALRAAALARTVTVVATGADAAGIRAVLADAGLPHPQVVDLRAPQSDTLPAGTDAAGSDPADPTEVLA